MMDYDTGLDALQESKTRRNKISSPPVSIPAAEWCRLCDALFCSPDTTIDSIIKKAQRLHTQIVELSKQVHNVAVARGGNAAAVVRRAL